MENVSIIIPSVGRHESLKRCLDSLYDQSYKNFKIYVVNDVAPLSFCRNKGAAKAKGDYLAFIDDDVVCDKNWLDEILNGFQANNLIVGVSGRAVITEKFKKNRDLFKYKFIKKLIYDKFFCDGKEYLPGHIMPSGAFTTGSSDESCDYLGEVQFLEACNMVFKTSVFKKVGGFSDEYKGVGEWQEPDICFRMRELGYKMWFNSEAKLYHEPSKSGVYSKRFKEADLRYQNYITFSNKWIKPNWKHDLFKLFMRGYFAIKTA